LRMSFMSSGVSEIAMPTIYAMPNPRSSLAVTDASHGIERGGRQRVE
jgi:hypothetical protein